jgi:glucose-6-phosphate 1-dehydrogenase
MPHDKASGAKPAGPCCMVIFGAAGDLTKRLVVPSLYNLACAHLLPQEFALVGVDLAAENADAWKKNLTEMLGQFVHQHAGDSGGGVEDDWKSIADKLFYVQGDLTNADSYQNLKAKLSEIDARQHTGGNYLFYLAIADRFFGTTIEQLAHAGLMTEENGQWRRVVVEKPFGHDLKSAEALNAQILKVISETQIYRIDHFLGKETVQNIMMFRFANGMFEPIWNRDRIDHIQITVAETVGVEKRGKFYETTGALRDMVPNHVFQLVAMTAMEAPNSFGAEAVRTEKAKAIEAIRIASADQVPKIAVRGQYGRGCIDDKNVPEYREEPDVAAESPIETYAAMKLNIDNWRWYGVPFYIRTGKRLRKRKTSIGIRFKEPPSILLRDMKVNRPAPNWLMLRIQPDEGMSLEFGAKIPGPTMQIGDVRMDFKYEDYFGTAPATGYETLIYDVMLGDATLFQRADNIESGWGVVQPVLDYWGNNVPTDFPNYRAGSDGPTSADELLQRDGRDWRHIV